MTTIKIEDGIVLRFGGGVHSRASINDIDPRECADGQNFDLDLQNASYRNRRPFELIGAAPNGSEIRGGGTLIKTDGTVKTFFQAGNTCYEWDGATGFTSIATVDSNAKLRGRIEHNWQLADKVIITDITLTDVVMEWDGTTLQDVSFQTEDPLSPTGFGTFGAKYCVINNERAYYFNVKDNGAQFNHLIVGSLRGDYAFLSTSDRPSSALNAEDPFFLIQPDYRAINGAVGAYGTIVTSSDANGSMFKLTGNDAKDFAMTELFPRSGASGDESVIYAGNDIYYGRKSVIESLAATDQFGDVEADDLSVDISDKIEGYKNWTAVYNAEKKRAYFFADTKTDCWVLHQSLLDGGVSPWSIWATDHSINFTPTFVMNLLDPSDELEYVFMGDSSGNIYRLEGKTEGRDGGTTAVITERLSGLFEMPLDLQSYDISGWIKYRKNQASDLTLRLEYQGMNVFNEEIQLSIPEAIATYYFGGNNYFNGSAYYGVLNFDKITRQIFAIPGRGNEFQVRASSTGQIELLEIGLRFEAAS